MNRMSVAVPPEVEEYEAGRSTVRMIRIAQFINTVVATRRRPGNKVVVLLATVQYRVLTDRSRGDEAGCGRSGGRNPV